MKGLNRERVRKALCRLAGNKNGGVMMEYVILAVLIAAAVVVAVAMFGKTIVNMFDVAAVGTTAREKTAKHVLEYARQEQDKDAAKARQYHDEMHEPL